MRKEYDLTDVTQFSRALPADERKVSAFPCRFLNFLCGFAAIRGGASSSWVNSFGKAEPFRTSGGWSRKFKSFA